MAFFYNSYKRAPGEIADVEILKKFGYTIGRRIGEGTYSKVCLALCCDEKGNCHKAAVKIVNKKNAGDEFIKSFLPRELHIAALVDHPNIVMVYNIVEIDTTVYMFMDYCCNGDLLEFISTKGALGETRSRHFFRQIVDAIQYLHKMNIAHRDLKCENILLTSHTHIKLSDFGFARLCRTNNSERILSTTFCGSAAYAAPEVLQGIPYNPKKYDIWALGCVLYIMMYAVMPFDDKDIKKMLRNQLSKVAIVNNIRFSKKSPSLTKLMQNLLEPNVNKRPSIKQIANCKWLHEQTVTKNRYFNEFE